MAIFHELDLVKFSEFFSVNFDELRQKSYVGILQRMPKPGSFASIACPLSEHLRARPKDFHL